MDREQRAEELRRIEEQEREEREKGKEELIDRLETSDKDAAQLVARSRREAERRATARASLNNPFRTSSARQQIAQVPDVPHVPIQDDWYSYQDKFMMLDTYDDPMSEAVRKDRDGIMRAGGYRVDEAWERALRTAVAGLDILPLQGLHPTGVEAEAVMPVS